MTVRGILADSELRRDFLIPQTPGHQTQDLRFSWRQSRLKHAIRGRCAASGGIGRPPPATSRITRIMASRRPRTFRRLGGRPRRACRQKSFAITADTSWPI